MLSRHGSQTTGTNDKTEMAFEVEAQVQVRNHPTDSSPDSEAPNHLADDEV